MYRITGGMRFIRREILVMAPTGSRGGPLHVCHVALCTVWHLNPHILDQLQVCPSNRIIISVSVTEFSHVTGLQEYPCNSKSCNRNRDSANMKTRTIKTCMQVDSCNSVIWPWNNSIHGTMIYVYEITVFDVIKHLCNGDTSTWNNSV